MIYIFRLLDGKLLSKIADKFNIKKKMFRKRRYFVHKNKIFCDLYYLKIIKLDVDCFLIYFIV